MEEGLEQVTQFVNPALDSRQWRSFKVGSANVRVCVRSGQYLCDCRLFRLLTETEAIGSEVCCGHIKAVLECKPVMNHPGVKAAPLPPKQTVEQLAKRVPFQGGFGRRKFREE